MFVKALFITFKTGNNSNGLHQMKDKHFVVYPYNGILYYRAIKENKLLIHTTTPMNFK